jgi:hypothetical protein
MPEIVDLFGEAPFTTIELTNAVELITPRPTLLGTLGVDLFPKIASRSGNIAAYKVGTEAKLVGTSPIGAPPERLEQKGGKMRRFGTRRMAKATTLYAIELQGILQQPLFQAVQSAQAEVAKRTALIRDDIELTFEYHRLGAVLGYQLDADGTTILEDWFDEWGITRPDPVFMRLDQADEDPRLMCRIVINNAKDAAGGAWVEGSTILHALCSEEYYVALISHPMIRETYMHYQAAAELRQQIADSFFFGGIVWHAWRSPHDARFGVASGTARTFPVGARDAFQHVMGPGEFGPYINQPGQETITITFGDERRQAWQEVELYTYPLFMCMRPEMLAELRLSSN